jgi:hypothetical protein
VCIGIRIDVESEKGSFIYGLLHNSISDPVGVYREKTHFFEGLPEP